MDAQGVVLARQRAKGQGRICQQRHAQAVHGLVQSVFITAVGQAIWVLHRHNARQAVLLCEPHKLMHPIWRFIGQTDVAHLALLHQFGQGLQLLVDGGGRFFFAGVVVHGPKSRHMALGPMDLVQVNDIGLQALQAGVARGQDVLGCHALTRTHPRHSPRWTGHFGGQHDALAHARVLGQPTANDGFRRSIGFGPGGHRIHLRRVDEIDPQGHGTVQDGMGRGLVDLLAKGHGAQANGGDVQIALSQANRVQ